MLRKPGFAIAVLNVYIISFLTVLQMDISLRVEKVMLLGASFVVLWMFYTIINYGQPRLRKGRVCHK